MRSLQASIPIGVTVVALQAFAVAQTSPPPAAEKPPATAAPSYPPPPPPGNQPPVNQPPPPGYQQPPPGYQQQPPPGYQPPPPGYQPPPPGYQPPPPGYQQQPPPGYQPPPPGYQQPPPGYYQQPPPGYYQQPPPGYYPPPGYGYPQQPPPAPRPPPRTHGFLAMPYLGFASFPGDAGVLYGPGFMIGALVGGRLNPSFSINAELRIDTINFKNVPSGERWEANEFDLDFSPLFHVQFASGEFVVGPKLGFAGYQEHDTDGGLETFSQHWSGLSAGFNGGVFFAVSRFMSLGGMLSFTVRDPSEVCSKTLSQSVEDCQSQDYQAEKVFGFHAAALF